jgi:hypothetical protein
MLTPEALDALVEEWQKRTAAGRPMPVTSEMLNNLREGMAAYGECDILRSERRSLAVDLGIARAERDAALQRCAALEAKLASIEWEDD